MTALGLILLAVAASFFFAPTGGSMTLFVVSRLIGFLLGLGGVAAIAVGAA